MPEVYDKMRELCEAGKFREEDFEFNVVDALSRIEVCVIKMS